MLTASAQRVGVPPMTRIVAQSVVMLPAVHRQIGERQGVWWVHPLRERGLSPGETRDQGELCS